ncbi:EF-hand domain-containing protein [archaeon]|nr:MAG: EF-hand domain-containing protein [archaeon]
MSSSAFSPFMSNEGFRPTSPSQVDKLKRPYHRDNTLVGYTGHFSYPPEDEHILNSPSYKGMIRGYTGHRPHRRSVVGEPIVPSEDKQHMLLTQRSSPFLEVSMGEEKVPTETGTFNFRAFAKHMDIVERYASSVQQLLDRGQNQEMLLRIVQAKFSERVSSYAQQLVRTRKLFEAFDVNGDGVLDEGEFRVCLEKLNIQFDDVQSLALFAYFDHNNDGFVEW